VLKDSVYHLHRRRFWVLSYINWGIAIASWGTSAYLGIAAPARMYLYSILFVVGLFAVVVGVVAWVIARFAHDVSSD
jgi:hypothetical protein